MQLLLKAIRLHRFQLSSLSLIMDVFETGMPYHVSSKATSVILPL